MKFKVGDRVIIIEDNGFYSNNVKKRGTVTGIGDEQHHEVGNILSVVFDNGGSDSGWSVDVKLIDSNWSKRIRACIAKRKQHA